MLNLTLESTEKLPFPHRPLSLSSSKYLWFRFWKLCPKVFSCQVLDIRYLKRLKPNQISIQHITMFFIIKLFYFVVTGLSSIIESRRLVATYFKGMKSQTTYYCKNWNCKRFFVNTVIPCTNIWPMSCNLALIFFIFFLFQKAEWQSNLKDRSDGFPWVECKC